MTAMADFTILHSINPIFQYIFDWLGFNPMNGNFDFVFQEFNRLWVVSVTLILNGSSQKIVQRGQITAPRRPIDFRISADYSIFENGAQSACQWWRLDFLSPQCDNFAYWPYWPFAQTIENVLENWVNRIEYCKASRGSHLNDVVFHS